LDKQRSRQQSGELSRRTSVSSTTSSLPPGLSVAGVGRSYSSKKEEEEEEVVTAPVRPPWFLGGAGVERAV